MAKNDDDQVIIRETFVREIRARGTEAAAEVVRRLRQIQFQGGTLDEEKQIELPEANALELDAEEPTSTDIAEAESLGTPETSEEPEKHD